MLYTIKLYTVNDQLIFRGCREYATASNAEKFALSWALKEYNKPGFKVGQLKTVASWLSPARYDLQEAFQ